MRGFCSSILSTLIREQTKFDAKKVEVQHDSSGSRKADLLPGWRLEDERASGGRHEPDDKSRVGEVGDSHPDDPGPSWQAHGQ